MKVLLTVPLLLTMSCSHLVSQVSTLTDDPAQVKSRVMKVVETQRQKKEWMKTPSCPADSMPEEGSRPKMVANDCSRDPSKCLERCDGNDGDSCYALAQLIQNHETIQNDVADVLYRHACRLGFVSGCTNSASNLFETEDKESVACAARTFDAACLKNDPWACAMNGLALADGIGRTKNITEANRSFDKACEVSVDKKGETCTRAKELKAALERSKN